MLTLCCYLWEIPFVISLGMLWPGWSKEQTAPREGFPWAAPLGWLCHSGDILGTSWVGTWEGVAETTRLLPKGPPGSFPRDEEPPGSFPRDERPPGSSPKPQHSSSPELLSEGGTESPRGQRVTSQGLNVPGKDREIPTGTIPTPLGAAVPSQPRRGAQDRGWASSLQLENIDEIKHLMIVTVVDF